jgi:hypothetical protein
MTKKYKKNPKLLRIIILAHIAFWGSFIFMAAAEKYPVVKGAILMNAPGSLSIISLILSLVIALLFYFWLKRQITQPHDINDKGVLYYLTFLVVFASLIVIPSVGLIINGAFDNSNPEIHNVEVVDKKIVFGRSGGKYIYIEDWENPKEKIVLRSNSSNYKLINIGDSIQVVTKKGYLGFMWRVSYSINRSENP